MLSGESNAGERWKTTKGLINKKATLHGQHTFFVHFFAAVLHDEGGGPQVGEVTCGPLPHLICKRDHI